MCTGSDLTHALLSEVATPADRLVVIGGPPQQVAKLAAAYGLNIPHHDPPMGFITDPQAVEKRMVDRRTHTSNPVGGRRELSDDLVRRGH